MNFRYTKYLSEIFASSLLLLPFWLCAQSITFNNTSTGPFGTIQTWTVPPCLDSITIEAWGAQGGNGTIGSGGLGARMKGTFYVTPGQVLKILVGQAGTQCGVEGGGGGGTFVTDNSNNPLIIAGGGGGSSPNSLGTGGTTGSCGLDGMAGGAAGGCAGSGGGAGADASSGGGLLTDGQNSGNYPCTSPTGAGKSFINGGDGGTSTCCGPPGPDGGFGGGGSTHGGSIGGGGGGGYSGGGGGANGNDGGGGGGSYNGGTNQSNSSNVRAGHGEVIITPLNATLAANAQFNASNVCDGTIVQFTDASTVPPSDTIQSWTWDFGDGSPADNSQNPSHNYSGPGTYSVKLTVVPVTNCIDTIVKNIIVYPRPDASYTAVDACLADTIQFDDLSTIAAPDVIQTWTWDFGDGSPLSSVSEPQHLFANAGTYPVSLIVVSNNGCKDTILQNAAINASPSAIFTAVNVCDQNPVFFTDQSTIPTNTANDVILSWSWDFGDGSPSDNSQNTNHNYSGQGTYTVQLIVIATNGCTDTAMQTLTVHPSPLALFDTVSLCQNDTVQFIDLSTVSTPAAIQGWAWDFNDGSPVSTASSPNHSFVNPGIYTVSLIVTADNGCKDTIFKNASAHPRPSALFTTNNACDGIPVTFTDQSTIPANPFNDVIQSWTWNFGDNSSAASGQNASHLFAATGPYTADLLVVSSFGCVDSASKVIVVNPNPIVGFTANDTVGCEPLCISFQNLSSIATGTNISLLWDFGDGSSTNNSQDVIHCYTNDSTFSAVSYSLSLTTTSDSGCVTSSSKTNYITVFPNTNADFTVQPSTALISDPVIFITNTSTGGTAWDWDFGDLQTASVIEPLAHEYADTGTYTILQVVSNLYNCADSAYQTIIIEPDFTFFVPNAFTPNGDGINDGFSGKGTYIKEFEMLIFDRWGNFIYKSDNIDKAWDGRANQGKEIAQPDVYVYVIKVIDFKEGKHNYRGAVTLVK